MNCCFNLRHFLVLTKSVLFANRSTTGNNVEPAHGRRGAPAAWTRARRVRLGVGLPVALLAGSLAASPVQAQTATVGTVETIGAGFSDPFGTAVDSSGNVYVADFLNNAVKMVPPGCTATTCVVTLGGTFAFKEPYGVALDASNNVYVADYGNNAIEKMPSTCTTSTCVTTVTPASAVLDPQGVTVDGSGNIYVTAYYSAVYKLSAGCNSSSCTVTQLGGGFAGPNGVAVDGSGNVYVADSNNNAVKEMPSTCTTSACVTTLGGGFTVPLGVAVDASGTVWVADQQNGGAAKEMGPGCTSAGCVTTLPGAFSHPEGIGVDGTGIAYIADTYNSAVKEIIPQTMSFGTVAVGSTRSSVPVSFYFTAAGSGISAAVVTQGASGKDFTDAATGTCDTNGTSHSYAVGSTCSVKVTFAPKYTGVRYGAVELLHSSTVIATAYIDGTGGGPQVVFGPPATQTQLGGVGTFSEAFGVAVDAAGNVYVADSIHNAVKEMTPGCTSSSCVTTLGGTFVFNAPYGVAVDGAGNIYVADGHNNAVEEMTPGCSSSACVTTLGGGFVFNTPTGVAVDATGNVYVADSDNNAIREMPPGCTSSSCVVTTLGGGFSQPFGIAVDASGNVYVADVNHSLVDEMTPGCASTSCVTPLGGGFDEPFAVAVDGNGDISVADYVNQAVKQMPPGCTTSSCVTTLRNGYAGPAGIAVDGAGNVYVADPGLSAMYEMNLATPPSLSFAQTNAGSQSSDSPKTVTLRNIGTASLTFPVPGSGENPSLSTGFTLDGSTTCPEVLASSSAGTLAPETSCALAVDFIPPTGGQITGSAVLKDNNLNVANTTQSIGLSGAAATPLTPYIQVNGGAWQQIASVAVNVGDTVNIGPQEINGGSWSWTGPNSFSATTRVLDGIPLTSPSNVFTLTYTNSGGITSTQIFTITVNSTAITPWLQVNGGAWQQIANVTVNVGDTVNLAPWPQTGGTWSWSGPSSFSSTSRVINGIALTLPSNVYTATYTNTSGVTSTQAFTITVNSTAITPYLQVNGGAWQQTASVTVNVGDTVNLAPWPQTGGTWSWSGPNSFSSTSRAINGIALTSPSNVYTATYTNTAGVTSTQAFTITVNSTAITPYLQVNGGAWQQTASVAVNVGDTVNLAPWPQTGGTWSWSGPNSFSSTSRAINGIALTSPSNVYTATYTNTAGVTSTQAFTITINPTTITPYIQVNGGAWQQISSVAVNVGDTVNLAPWPQTGGTWSWSGPNSFSSTSRAINGISLTSPSNVYTATYTNTAGVTSTQAFTITINPTTVTPYIQVNGGAWQQLSTVAVNVGDKVNLGPQQFSGGTYSWTGPNSFSATTRTVNGISLTAASNVYTLTYTNVDGVASSPVAFTITINPTPIVPYVQVNGGAWQQISSVAVNVGDTVNLAPWPQTGGTWSWTGPNSFSSTSRAINSISLTSATNVYTATYTNADGVTSTQAFTITINPTPITPYIQVNGGAWQQAATLGVNVGDTVNIGPQQFSGGTYSWTGPNSFSATTRTVNGISLTAASNVYTLTYTNVDGVASMQTFTITINPTPLTPYVQVNGGAWQQSNSVAVNVGDTVNIGPQQISGGSWSWSGPNSFSSTSRALNNISLTSPTNVYTVTYTNVDGVTSTQTFTISINPTTITPWIQVNGGAWQQVSSATVTLGSTVNLAPWPQTGGTWSWSGPNSFASTSRAIYAIPLSSGANNYTATYTNADGVTSTQTFTITAN